HSSAEAGGKRVGEVKRVRCLARGLTGAHTVVPVHSAHVRNVEAVVPPVTFRPKTAIIKFIAGRSPDDPLQCGAMDRVSSFAGGRVERCHPANGARFPCPGSELGKTMTITIHLSPEAEKKLQEIAARAGQSLEQYIEQLAEQEALGVNGA